ncbi:MAG: hypothetical protein RLZZ198_1809 [Bacteroidota bacterium]
MIAHPQSGRQDSNLRPPGPKPGAMTGLRYAPNESSSSIFNAHQPSLMFYLFSLTNPSVSHPFQPPRYCGGSGITFGGLRFATARTLRFLIPSNLHVIAVGAGLPSVVFASLRHEPCGFSSLPTSTLLRWERDYLRWSSLRYGTNPAVSHPFQPPRYCGGSGIRTRGTVTRTTV